MSPGLSPRVRGKPPPILAEATLLRSIPAGAGETHAPHAESNCAGVYPRGCGGNSGKSLAILSTRGLSPRVRGKRIVSFLYFLKIGSIPAGAGETATGRHWAGRHTVYPRGCGGNFLTVSDFSALVGLSPRVRGKHPTPAYETIFLRSIPAGAGETPNSKAMRFFKAVYPRGCGGNGQGSPEGPPRRGLSPRVRGKPLCRSAPR